jgi:hypothetical protein
VRIPFLELASAYRELKHEFDEALHRVLERGWYVLGEANANEKAHVQARGRSRNPRPSAFSGAPGTVKASSAADSRTSSSPAAEKASSSSVRLMNR